MSIMIRRVGIGMAAACLAATGADVAQAQAISTDVECTDTLQGKRIKGDVTVPSGASCTLSGVQVVGNVTAAADTRLVVSESKIRGDVVVNGLGAVNTPQPSTAQLTDSIITGQLTQTSATTVTVTGSTHLTLENTEVNSDIVARHRSDVTVENSQVHGNLSTQGDTVVRSSDVDGAAVVDAYASRLCGSQFADLSVSTYYGATIGDGQACSGNDISGDLTFTETVITLKLFGNKIDGNTNVDGTIRRAYGQDNVFGGQVPDQLAGLG
ncbi:MAG: hypothetical protein CSB46_08750 [Micrococcales bacterium]|nr:MAG: hypothetical protein CSB46_08750 [Micrococcales bacterium]